ncbi:MAG: hypothetical protein ACE37F_14905 [Nannocystaceae bacterium]|nr:hypothetical protein [bacterium]
MRRSSAGSWSFAGLCGLALGALLTMFNPPTVHAKTKTSIHRVGYAVNAGAIGCFAVGEVIRRRNRIRALVELRSATSPATPSSVEMLREDESAGEVWIVSERPCVGEVLVEAAHRGVRCFIEGPDGFEEVAAPHENGARRRMDA